MPYRLMRALNSTTDIRCRMLTLGGIHFPTDVVDPPWGRCRQMIAEADVVHVHGLTTYGLFQKELQAGAFLVQIHGVPDRGVGFEPDVPHVVATPDLLQDFPGALFLPNLVLAADLPLSAPLGAGPLRIFKSPSLHDKNQELFELFLGPIIQRLAPRVQYVAPPGPLPHAQLARLRASCQVSLDHLQGYYGLESLEALAQGLVAVNGASEQALSHLDALLGAPPPFAVAREPARLGQLLLRLVEQALGAPEQLARRRARGANFMARHYTVGRLVSWWRYLYEALLQQHAWPEPGDGLCRIWSQKAV